MPRKVAFSGKAKKEQLKQKKNKNAFSQGKKPEAQKVAEAEDVSRGKHIIQKLNEPSTARSGRAKPNRYALQFYRETESELRERKEAARKQLVKVPEKALEINLDDYFDPVLDFPKRPAWDFAMSREELEAKEHEYFRDYLLFLESKFDFSKLTYFELNLETWRQLWRVLEMSDIILVIVDIRYAALMFPPNLYSYVTENLGKQVILILNKIDLAPAPLVVAWTEYFKQKYPKLHVLQFTSFPAYNIRGGQAQNKSGLKIRRIKGRPKMAAEGAQKLLEACKSIVKNEVDLTSWENKIAEEMHQEYENEGDDDDDAVEIGKTIDLKTVDTSFHAHVKYNGGVLTVGCIGQPNVGKSSLMNAIMGKKVVSVSRTPGHTKYFQTIYLTSNVRLCDCPGLVFPSKVPKQLQVLMGSYPIAQLREPFSAVQYLAERLHLVKLLNIAHPENSDEWSAMDICDGWAQKRGFRIARTGWLDSYRAANNILQMALDGKITLCLYPPGYTEIKAFWESHKDVKDVYWLQAKSATSEANVNASKPAVLDEEDEELSSKDEGSVTNSDTEESGDDDYDDDSDTGDMMVLQNKFTFLPTQD